MAFIVGVLLVLWFFLSVPLSVEDLLKKSEERSFEPWDFSRRI